MAGPWIRIYTNILQDRAVQTLPPGQFRRKFLARIGGAENEFSPFVKPDPSDGRVFSKLWRMIRTIIFHRDNFTCRYCGVRGGRLECDHVIPVSRGGATNERNLVTACKPCNRSKGDKTLEEWLRE